MKILKKNFDEIKKIFGNNVKIGIENNNYYPTRAYNFITDCDFIYEVVMENDIEFLFDIAHAGITAFNKDIDFEDYISCLPLERLIQIHVCQFAAHDKTFAYDAHNSPGEKEWGIIKSLILKYSVPKYITVEYYKKKNLLINSLISAGKIIHELSEQIIQSK